jgi:hypothetical protein
VSVAGDAVAPDTFDHDPAPWALRCNWAVMGEMPAAEVQEADAVVAA